MDKCPGWGNNFTDWGDWAARGGSCHVQVILHRGIPPAHAAIGAAVPSIWTRKPERTLGQ